MIERCDPIASLTTGTDSASSRDGTAYSAGPSVFLGAPATILRQSGAIVAPVAPTFGPAAGTGGFTGAGAGGGAGTGVAIGSL